MINWSHCEAAHIQCHNVLLLLMTFILSVLEIILGESVLFELYFGFIQILSSFPPNIESTVFTITKSQRHATLCSLGEMLYFRKHFITLGEHLMTFMTFHGNIKNRIDNQILHLTRYVH